MSYSPAGNSLAGFMERAMNPPSVSSELGRKTIETLIHFETMRANKLITEREAQIACEAIFAVTSGLTGNMKDGDGDLIPIVQLLGDFNESIEHDESFIRNHFYKRESNDNHLASAVLLRFSKNHECAVVRKMNVMQEVCAEKREDESTMEFIVRTKRLFDKAVLRYGNYEEVV
jgi:hypothetical protein